MFRRILVPLDGSPRARQALPFAARIAQASGGAVVLLSVLEPTLQVAWRTQLVPVRFENQAAERKRLVADLARQAASETLHGVETTVEVAEGLPAPLILERAETLQADLIVLCSHGRTGLARWALGSVAQKVACQSAIPVLITREEHTQGKGLPVDGVRPVCVMVALDGSAFAEVAVRPAAELSLAFSTPLPGVLHLVQVVPLLVEPVHAVEFTRGSQQSYDLLPLEETRVIAAATAYLDRIQQQIQEEVGGSEKLRVTTSVLADPDVAGSLLAEAEQMQRSGPNEGLQGCDVLALATHGRSGLARWAVGSVAQRVMSVAKQPLLMVRPPATQEQSR